MREVNSGRALIPVCPTHNNPARTASQVLRSRIKEMQINPVSTIATAEGTGGRQRMSPAAVRLSDLSAEADSGGWRNAFANSLIRSQTVLEPRLQVTTLMARSAERDTARAGLSETTVGDALAAEDANSSNTTAKVFLHPLNKFFPTPNN